MAHVLLLICTIVAAEDKVRQTNMNLFQSPCMLVVRVHMDCQIFCSCSRYVWPDGIFSVSWSGCAYYFHQCM